MSLLEKFISYYAYNLETKTASGLEGMEAFASNEIENKTLKLDNYGDLVFFMLVCNWEPSFSLKIEFSGDKLNTNFLPKTSENIVLTFTNYDINKITFVDAFSDFFSFTFVQRCIYEYFNYLRLGFDLYFHPYCSCYFNGLIQLYFRLDIGDFTKRIWGFIDQGFIQHAMNIMFVIPKIKASMESYIVEMDLEMKYVNSSDQLPFKLRISPNEVVQVTGLWDISSLKKIVDNFINSEYNTFRNWTKETIVKLLLLNFRGFSGFTYKEFNSIIKSLSKK